jgi:hypothetical protein
VTTPTGELTGVAKSPTSPSATRSAILGGLLASKAFAVI